MTMWGGGGVVKTYHPLSRASYRRSAMSVDITFQERSMVVIADNDHAKKGYWDVLADDTDDG